MTKIYVTLYPRRYKRIPFYYGFTRYEDHANVIVFHPYPINLIIQFRDFAENLFWRFVSRYFLVDEPGDHSSRRFDMLKIFRPIQK